MLLTTSILILRPPGFPSRITCIHIRGHLLIDAMSGQRHVACRLCRERKVKCSGESEACDQCRRTGERCVYMPTYRPSKVELADTVELMQKRLGTFPSQLS